MSRHIGVSCMLTKDVISLLCSTGALGIAENCSCLREFLQHSTHARGSPEPAHAPASSTEQIAVYVSVLVLRYAWKLRL
jgi:hypothetical protein